MTSSRRSALSRSRSIAMERMAAHAEPTDCVIRGTSSNSIDGAAAAATHESTYVSRPPRSMLRRPSTSEKGPSKTCMIEKPAVYTDMVASVVVVLACISACKLGSDGM